MYSGSLSAAGRRTIVALGLAAVVLTAASGMLAQGAGAPAAPAQDPYAAFRFASADAGMIIWPVPLEKVADFESVWATIMAKLAASDKPDLKQLGSTMKIYKPSAQPAAGQPLSYFIVADPTSKTMPYSPVYLLYEAGLFDRAEGEALFKKLPTDGISALPLKKVQ